jgi:hypothetical protein
MHQRPRTHRTRSAATGALSSQRGAVLVEAVIAIAMLLLMFAGAFFFHRLYVEKLASIQTARRQAWTAAMPGCGGGALGGLAPAQWLASLTSAPPAVGEMPNGSTPGLLEIGAAPDAPVSESVPSSPLLGGGSFTVSTSTRFACNETPQQFDDVASLAEWIAQLFIPGGH